MQQYENREIIGSSQEFVKSEAMSAKCLLYVTLLALFLSNSHWHGYYEIFFHNPHFLLFVNEGLMTIFFLVVSMEIKYELLVGALNTLTKAMLPGIAAIGGMIVPAMIYIVINYQNSMILRGWAIPTATDVAFALGVLSLLGSRMPSSLKSFLAALAILDDLVAIVIVAIFYTTHLSFTYFGFACVCLISLFLLNAYRISRLLPYCVMGFLLWGFLLKSGVHATLAGVALALFIPLEHMKDAQYSPLKKLKHNLQPWIAFGILPLFAFSNAGVSLDYRSITDFQMPIVGGILLGLFLGKQIGVFSACWLAVKLRLAKLPDHVTWPTLYGVAILCGIGFTISLFIGTLAFGDKNLAYLSSVKIGVLAGSVLSGGIGYFFLRYAR